MWRFSLFAETWLHVRNTVRSCGYILYSFGLILRFDIWRATELKMIECFGRLCTSFPHLVVNWSLQNTFIATNILHHKLQIQKQVFVGPLWNYKLTTCFCYSVFLTGACYRGSFVSKISNFTKTKESGRVWGILTRFSHQN